MELNKPEGHFSIRSILSVPALGAFLVFISLHTTLDLLLFGMSLLTLRSEIHQADHRRHSTRAADTTARVHGGEVEARRQDNGKNLYLTYHHGLIFTFTLVRVYEGRAEIVPKLRTSCCTWKLCSIQGHLCVLV